MAAGLYGLRSQQSFERTITELVEQGGDADTNGAVCGAVLCARIGYAALPSAWIEQLPYRAWLDAHVEVLLAQLLAAPGADSAKYNNNV